MAPYTFNTSSNSVVNNTSKINEEKRPIKSIIDSNRTRADERFDTSVENRRSSINELDYSEQIIYGKNIHKAPIPIVEDAIFSIPAKGHGRSFGYNKKLLSKHTLLLGGIGCGKTNVFNFLISGVIKNLGQNDVLIIFDTKGDFERKFRKNDSQMIIGNGEQYSNCTVTWNLFEEILPENMYRTGEYKYKTGELEAKELAKQLFEGRQNQSQPFFTNAAIDLFAKVVIHFMRHKKKEEWNNGSLVEFLKKSTIEDYRRLLSIDEDMASTLTYLGKGENNQGMGVLGEMNSMVDDLLVGIFGAKPNSQNRSFSMKSFVREKGAKVLFIEYDLKVGEILGPIYRILIDFALKEALGRNGAYSDSDASVYFMIDEFKLLPNLKYIDAGLNFGRGLGVKICAGIQSIAQLEEMFGDAARAEVVAAGFMNFIAFQSWDPKSRDYIMRRFGVNYKNIAFNDLKGEKQYLQKEGHNVEDWEIIDLVPGEAFINLNGFEPFFYSFEYRS